MNPRESHLLDRQGYLPNVESLLNHPEKASVFIAEVYAFDQPYPDLGVEPGFNCLSLRGDAQKGFTAIMVPLHDRDDQECLRLTNPKGISLDVNRLVMSTAKESDYPPVARWEWDAQSKKQYIGVKCGLAWCRIHAHNQLIVPSKPYSRAGNSGRQRVVGVPGWYDQQLLAMPAARVLIVGHLQGTLIPEPTLGDDNRDPVQSDFAKRWVKVATIAIEDPSEPNVTMKADPGEANTYFKKLSLRPSPMPDPQNELYLCYAPSGGTNNCFPNPSQAPNCSASASTPGWYAMSKFPGSQPVYRCVIRREHKGIRIPGIVRWRWQASDDTYWTRCLNGCCEVRPGA